MKRFFILFLLVMSVIAVSAQTWVGYTTTSVNMREEPSTESAIVKKLKPKTLLYIDTDDEVDGFYLAVDFENDIEGYVSKKYVKHYKDIAKSNSASIQSTGKTDSYIPTISVSNNTSTTMTLRVNSTTYKFSPNETRTITVSPGKFTYRASSPGVIPASGSYNAESYSAYTWNFWINTRRY